MQGPAPSVELTPGQSGRLVLASYLLAALLGILLSHGIYRRSFFETAAAKGDNHGYLQLTDAILHHRLDDPSLARHRRLYLGMPLLVASAAAVSRLDARYAMPLICWIAASLAWYLACLLYGPTVAALILCMNFFLVERFLYGGPEAPALLFGLLGLWLARRSGVAAALAMAIATSIRPFALMFLVALWAIQIRRRAWRELAASVLIPGLVGAAYLVFVDTVRLASDPIGGYSTDWYSASPVSFPFWPMIRTLAAGTETPLSLIKQLSYALAVLVSAVALARSWGKQDAAPPLDKLAFALSAGFLFSYNSPYILGEFARFAVLCFPFTCYILWRTLAGRLAVRTPAIVAVCLGMAIFSALSAHNVDASLRYLAGLFRSLVLQ